MVPEIVGGGVRRRAYVTFLAGDGEYWKDVVRLAKGLRMIGAAGPLVVALLPDVQENHRRVLDSQGCIVRAPPALYFNADIFIFDPSISICESLLATLKVTPPTPFAEQDFLNMFFRDVYKPIPLEYNLALAMLWRHPEKVDLENVKVVHCCAAGSKPWRYTGKEENMDREDIKLLVKRWWDVYNGELLGHKSGVVVVAAMEAAVVAGGLTWPLMQALAMAGAVKYGTAPSAA